MTKAETTFVTGTPISPIMAQREMYFPRTEDGKIPPNSCSSQSWRATPSPVKKRKIIKDGMSHASAFRKDEIEKTRTKQFSAFSCRSDRTAFRRWTRLKHAQEGCGNVGNGGQLHAPMLNQRRSHVAERKQISEIEK